MNRSIRLTLSSPIYYRSTSYSLDEARAKADKAAPGYDAAVLFSYSYSNELLTAERIASGEREGYSEEEKRIIESGGVLGRKEDEDFQIPAGIYLFEQLPFIPDEKDLMRLILPYATRSSGTVFARLYKESILECVMQLLFPTG